MSQNKEVLVNRVANSGLITINLEDHYPKVEVVEFDLKDYLFMELMLKEKDFRTALKEVQWEEMKDKVLCVFCSTDAIIPQWAYMLVATYATPYAKDVVQMTQKEWTTQALVRAIQSEDYSTYEGKRVVVKGCGDKDVGPAAYLEVAKQLQPYAQSIMFGEPCSTVPIFKRPRVLKK